MLKNYLKIAWRKLTRNKIDSAISIGGLAVGIACCTLLLLSVRYEFSFNNFQKNGDHLFRVWYTEVFANGGLQPTTISPYPLARALTSTFPAVEHTVRLQGGSIQLKMGDKFYPKRVLFAGPTFFQMFTFPLIAGNKNTALSQPHSIVLSQKMARKLFHKNNALGKMVTFRLRGVKQVYKVTAVTENIPKNSSFQFNIVLPFADKFIGLPEGRQQTMKNSWYNGGNITWVELHKNASAKDLEALFPFFIKKHYKASSMAPKSMSLQPLGNIYFSQKFRYTFAQHTNMMYTIILAVIALIILAIASFNFISLTLSRIEKRRNETGIRMAAGAQRRQFSGQLLGEIFITCGIALIVGMALAQLAAPAFRHIIGKPLPLNLFATPIAWLIMGAILLFITLITGLYPAWFIYRRGPASLFRSRGSTMGISPTVKGFIILQFALSIAFLIVTVTIQGQLNFMLHGKDLGYSPANVISIPFSSSFINKNDQLKRKATLYRERVKKIAGIQEVSLSTENFNRRMRAGMALLRSGTKINGLGGTVAIQTCDANFLQTMQIKLLKGHGFTPGHKNGIIVNSKFVKTAGLHHPIGHIIHDVRTNTPSGSPASLPLDGKRVIGVVGNYNFMPLNKKLKPLVLENFDTDSTAIPGALLVRMSSRSKNATINKLKILWANIFPHKQFKYDSFNDLIATQYMTQRHWSKIMKIAAIIAILLACFGLFGLTMLAVQRRTKEIGIRKVMGASVRNIVALLSKDFLKLVFIGFVIAIPVGWYFMHRWLQNFAYKIHLRPWIFLLAGAIALIIALATVSWQSIRAALTNPVDSLRSE